MKVKATMLGFYGNKRRYEGDVFELTDDKQFSKKWMAKFEPSEPVAHQAKAARMSDKDKTVI
jgi:hypothetical protein